MSDPIMNSIAVAIWGFALMLFVNRQMEVKGLRYRLEQTPHGLEFRYRLGVYGGTVQLVRDVDTKEPHLAGNVFGWECKFPVAYTNPEMMEYIRAYAPQCNDGESHSKDLLIFNEVINNKNDGLVCINTKIYVYDNTDHRPFNSK